MEFRDYALVIYSQVADKLTTGISKTHFPHKRTALKEKPNLACYQLISIELRVRATQHILNKGKEYSSITSAMESRYLARVDRVALGDLRTRYTAPHISLA